MWKRRVRPRHTGRWALLLSIGWFDAALGQAGALSAVQVLRAGGCGGLVPLAPYLRHDAGLDRAARDWAAGEPLAAAAERHGYRAAAVRGLRVAASEKGLLERLRRADCWLLTDRRLRAMGVYRGRQSDWLLLASGADRGSGVDRGAGADSDGGVPPRGGLASDGEPPAVAVAVTRVPVVGPGSTPLAAPGSETAARALELVNAARVRGGRCGARHWPPAPPLRLSATLGQVASGHAVDMATHDYFDHEDLAGHSPADRVRASGYRESLVGENLAYGPESIEEAVQGWLDSPDHCENIMDPRFLEMGVAARTGHGTAHEQYWVQVLAAPRR